MALTIGQKSERVLRFLRGLSHPRVASALAAHGFSQADWDEGWQLLQTASGRWLLREQPTRAPDPTVIEELDAWENRWFPVAEATLRRRKPEVADKIFLNLAQTSGIEVAVSVAPSSSACTSWRRTAAPPAPTRSRCSRPAGSPKTFSSRPSCC